MPTQLEAFDLLAAKLTHFKPDGSYSQVGFIPWLNQGKYLFSWNPSFGGSFYDSIADKITVNDPRNVQVLTWMKEYANRYGYSSLKGSFTGSTVAMLVETNGYTQTLNTKSGFDYGVTYMPAPSTGKQKATYAGGFGIAVPSGAKHVSEAAEFIAFWVGDEAQLIRARAKGCYPASLKAARDQFFLKDPVQRVFIEMLPNAVARPNIPILGALWDGIKETTDRVLVKNEVPQAVLDDVTQRTQLLLDQARKL
jgi:multiple sugar transport system substrate-binding protein